VTDQQGRPGRAQGDARWERIDRRYGTLRVPTAVLATPLGEDFLALADVPGVLINAGTQAVISRNAASAAAVQSVLERLDVDPMPLAWRTPSSSAAVPFGAGGLYPHQREAATWLLRQGGGILADVMGLGKTRAGGSAAATWQQDEGGPVVIVAPRHTYSSWAQQLTDLGAIEAPEALVKLTGATPSDEPLKRGSWWFIHYQIAHAWVGHMRVSPRGRLCCAIVDEVHWIRNPKSRMARAVLAVAGCARHRVALTGTPLVNRTAELWPLLTLVAGPGQFGSHFEFRQRYACALHGGYGYVDTGPTRVVELRERLVSCYMRRTLDDVPGLTLPPHTRRALVVESSDALTASERKAWDLLDNPPWPDATTARELLDMFAHNAFGTETLRVLTALRKASAVVKEAAIMAHVTSLLDAGESVVVFSWQRASAGKLAVKASTQAYNAWAITGLMSADERTASIEAFTAEGGLLTATMDSLREGVTLTRAAHVVISDLSWVPSDMLQAEARISRISQTRPTTAWWALAKGSVDEIIAVHLLDKVTEQEVMLGDAVGAVALDGLGIEAALGIEHQTGAELAKVFL